MQKQDKIRVQVVDDSVVIRRALAALLNEDPDIEVVDVSSNGQLALSKLESVDPDIVLLDVEMPVLNGLDALREIRVRDRSLPVIMFSSLTARGATTTVEALSLGASDYVTKPASDSLESSLEGIRRSLLPKIHGLCRPSLDCGPTAKECRTVPRPLQRPVSRAVPELTTPARAKQAGGRPIIRKPGMFDPAVVALGVSTGGPNALTDVLPELPASFPVPIVIVQHMPALFTKLLAERLDAACALNVREAQGGELVQPGNIWLAPGDRHLVVTRDRGKLVLALNEDPPENSCRPAVDVLFRSVAASCRGRAVGVILTGMGNDGFVGSQQLKAAGAPIVAQDKETSVVWGMPGCVVENGVADVVLPLDRVAEQLMLWTQSMRAETR